LQREADAAGKKAEDAMNGFNPKHQTGAMETLGQTAGAMMSIVSSLQMASAAFKTFGDESLSVSERVTSGITGIVMVLPGLISGINSLTTAMMSNPVLAAVTIGLTAIAGLVLWITASIEKPVSKMDKLKKQLEADTEALAELNDQLKETENHLEEVKSLLEEYSEVQNTFDTLIEGSTAWNEALEKNAEIIDKLLEKYPELQSALRYDERG
jgi:methyl-accepting chemotaxis protein